MYKNTLYCKYKSTIPVESDQGYYYTFQKTGEYKRDEHGCYLLEYRLSPTEPWPYVMKLEYLRPNKSDKDWKKHTPFPMIRLKLVKKS
uniref:Uncharacterized protein n=1 Tax=viral metagenome TaxID=1070528 RepID=A0A6C0KVU7_9ZZZZ